MEEENKKFYYYIENLESKKDPWYKKVKRKVAWKYNQTILWFGNHWIEVVIWSPIIASAGMTTIKFVKMIIPKKTVAEKELDMKNFTFYDRHTNMRFDLSRKLTNAEKTKILDAIKDGNRVDDVLKDMGVLKK